ncbi:MAG: ribosomal protein S18-alanine N-acetyltransferase [Thermodesulfobacteriota bacterium]|nr:ribosomal protein S18-alanine N-acetyltransferase [Thermodesulfobacteriota bacterium]
MNKEGEIDIREMTERDLDEVMQIERVSFPTPWSRRLFERELSLPYAKSFIAREMSLDQVVGYLCFWLLIPEAHILNLAVRPERRWQGIGNRLLRYGVDYCLAKGVREITLEVRRSNYKAISLYRNLQFQPRGIRRRYYSDSGEDAIIMGLRLAEADLLTAI